jgi:hypothetical protein
MLKVTFVPEADVRTTQSPAWSGQMSVEGSGLPWMVGVKVFVLFLQSP